MDKTIHNNGLTRKELFLLKPFVKEPWREFTLSEIKKICKNKSHHYVFDALKKFVLLALLKGVKRGNTNIYCVNYENTDGISYFAFVESLLKEKMANIPFKNLIKIKKKIKNVFFSLVVCGSYAENKQKLNSDLDVAIIIPNCESKKSYEIALKEGELMIPEVHGFVFTQEEFYLMLTNDEFNYGKELARKHIIVCGAEPFYSVLFEALKNGFKG